MVVSFKNAKELNAKVKFVKSNLFNKMEKMKSNGINIIKWETKWNLESKKGTKG